MEHTRQCDRRFSSLIFTLLTSSSLYCLQVFSKFPFLYLTSFISFSKYMSLLLIHLYLFNIYFLSALNMSSTLHLPITSFDILSSHFTCPKCLSIYQSLPNSIFAGYVSAPHNITGLTHAQQIFAQFLNPLAVVRHFFWFLQNSVKYSQKRKYTKWLHLTCTSRKDLTVFMYVIYFSQKMCEVDFCNLT